MMINGRCKLVIGAKFMKEFYFLMGVESSLRHLTGAKRSDFATGYLT